MIFRSENYIEGGREYMVFFEKIFVADSNQIAVSYSIGSQLNSGIVKVPAIEPIFFCGSQKYGFFGFLRFSLK
jgi:hypothetical protein